MTKWRNNKNGEVYHLIAQATDCTNSRDGTPVLIYSSEDRPEKLYVREVSEFEAKFTQIANDETRN